MQRKCFRCGYSSLNKRDEKIHNFLSHQTGGRQTIEDKPVKKHLQRYCINFSEDGVYYNFYDSRELVYDFLTVFENAFVPRPNLRWGRFKCVDLQL